MVQTLSQWTKNCRYLATRGCLTSPSFTAYEENIDHTCMPPFFISVSILCVHALLYQCNEGQQTTYNYLFKCFIGHTLITALHLLYKCNIIRITLVSIEASGYGEFSLGVVPSTIILVQYIMACILNYDYNIKCLCFINDFIVIVIIWILALVLLCVVRSP